MGDGAQELHGVTLGLQGEVAGGGAFHGNRRSLDLKRLLGIGGFHQGALDDQGCANIDLGDVLEVFQSIGINYLHRGEEGAVV